MYIKLEKDESYDTVSKGNLNFSLYGVKNFEIGESSVRKLGSNDSAYEEYQNADITPSPTNEIIAEEYMSSIVN